MKKLALFTTLAILGSACTAGVGPEESVEGLSDAVSYQCNTLSGLRPTKASLAVAMATELKRWDPLVDLTRTWINGAEHVVLSSAGHNRCSAMGSNCANTKALLGLQDQSITQVIEQSRFNPTSYRHELLSGFQRQIDRNNDLARNAPARLPSPHRLTKVGGPTNLGIGACGPHWVFKPERASGGSYPDPADLANNLYFFGHPTNDYLAFTVTNGNVAIDPIDGDNSAPLTTSGSCPTYELDRVYSPASDMRGLCCITVSGQNGALAAVPKAYGYYGCKAGLVPTR
jgi:hypothetical protein